MGVKIYDDEKGHWLQINSKKLTGGKRPKSFFGFGPEAKKACAAAAAEIKQKIGEGKFAIKRDVEKKTLREIGDEMFSANGQHRRESTLESYSYALEHVYPDLGDKFASEITDQDIKKLLSAWRHDAKGSIALRLNVLGTILNYAVRKGYIQRSPLAELEPAFKRGLRKRDTVAKVRAMSKQQLDVVLDALQAHVATLTFYTFWLLLGRTGLRIGEAMALQPDDIEQARAAGKLCRRILVQRAVYKGKLGPTKTGESRYVDISDELALALDELIADLGGTEWIFPSVLDPKEPASYLYWWKHLKAATKGIKLGMKMSPHLFRHTFASQLLQEGGLEKLKYVSEQLGHARTSMTLDVYAHFIPSEGKIAPVNSLDTGRTAHPRRSQASIHNISERAIFQRRKKLTA